MRTRTAPKTSHAKSAQPLFSARSTSTRAFFAPTLQAKCTACDEERNLQRREAAEEEPIRAAPLQPKLAIGKPGDRYEQEADRMAAAVMRSAEPGALASGPRTAEIQRMPITPVGASFLQRDAAESCSLEGEPVEEGEEENEETEDVEVIPEAEKLVSPKREAGEVSPPPHLESRLDASRGGGSSLPASTREFMESHFDYDFSGVRVHTGVNAEQLNRDVRSLAFTSGRDIYFGPGQYRPDTDSGQHLLAHELTHVVQQNRSGAPAVMKYDITLQGGTGLWSAESLRSIHDQLAAWGVVDPGSLATVNERQVIGDTPMGPLTENDIRTGMTTIETLRTRGGPGGTPYTERVVGRGASRRTAVYPGRIVAAWNARKDDLGPGRTYPTILHFVVRLERTAQASMGMSYLQAIGQMPTVRLAGLEIGVHPRAVYFTAAAQAEMDVRSGLAEGAGHYMPPGAFFIELRRFRRLARSLARPPARRRRGTSPAAAEQAADRLGIVAVNRMRADLRMMVDTMRRQAAHTANEPIEHREPGLQRYLVPLADQIEAMPLAANAAEVRTLAGQIDRIVSAMPYSERAHGGGSIDPHGTAHALGLAIDMFNGVSDEGVYQNFGVPAQNWPFLHLLMDRFGQSEAMRTLRPGAIHELQPAEALELASLVAAHGNELAEELRGRAAEIASPEGARARRATLAEFAQIRNRVLRAYTLRWQLLTRAHARSAWYRGADDVRQLAEECRTLMIVDRRTFANLSPDQVRSGLGPRLPRLQELYDRGAEAAGRARSAAAEVAEREAGQREEDAAQRERQLDEDLQRAQEAWEARSDALVTELAEARRLRRRAEARELIRERDRLQSHLRRARRQTAGRAGRARRHQAAERRATSSAAAAERRRSADLAVLEAVRPSAGSPSLEALGDQLTGTIDFQSAFGAEREAQALRAVRSPGFNSWLARVSNIERPMADQPQLMVESLNAVLSHPPASWTHFFGGHHWDIAPVNILSDAAQYTAALERDMRQQRRREMMDRVLTIMAESAGGRRILNGSDPTFTQVLERVFPGEGAARRQRALTSVTSGAAGGSPAVVDFLRTRGFRYLAGDESAPGKAGSQAPATDAE